MVDGFSKVFIIKMNDTKKLYIVMFNFEYFTKWCFWPKTFLFSLTTLGCEFPVFSVKRKLVNSFFAMLVCYNHMR